MLILNSGRRISFFVSCREVRSLTVFTLNGEHVCKKISPVLFSSLNSFPKAAFSRNRTLYSRTPALPLLHNRLSDNSKNPSPLAGEGKGEGTISLIYNVFFTLPLSLPSREGYKMALSDSLLRGRLNFFALCREVAKKEPDDVQQWLNNRNTYFKISSTACPSRAILLCTEMNHARLGAVMPKSVN